ncbi:MAG: sulfatase-like hydrolase/transferase [Planctomycetales bacterium]|nr:sulfatase-like hydrolase/transferase [Planctomycetales bacterium]
MSRPPSVVLVCLDSLRADAVGAEGDRRLWARYGVTRPARTPTLDALAAEGVRCSRAYTTAPHTPPAHAALFTGLPPAAHGVRSTFSRALAPGATTLAARLRARGYRTIACYEEDFRPFFESLDLCRGVEERFLGDEEAAVAACGKGPAFLFVHVGDIHHLYGHTEVPASSDENDDFARRFARLREEFPAPGLDGLALDFQYEAVKREAFRRGRLDRIFEEYLFGVEKCDAGRLRRLLGRLERAGLLADSILALFADHGEMAYPWGFFHGGHLAEEVLRVPLVVRAPGRLPPGRTEPAVASLADLPATVLELAGFPDEGCRGSLLPVWRGEEDPAGRRAYSEIWIEDTAATMRRMQESRERGALSEASSRPFLLERAWRGPAWKYLRAGLTPEEEAAVPAAGPGALPDYRLGLAFQRHVHVRPNPILVPAYADLVRRGWIGPDEAEAALASHRPIYPKEALLLPDEDPAETADRLAAAPLDGGAAAFREEALAAFARLGPAPGGETTPVTGPPDLAPREAAEAEAKLRTLGYL